MTTVDVFIFVVYLIGIVLFGSSFYRKNKTPSAFTLGNNTLPSWVITLSIFATFVSSISYLALPGQAYLTNWNAFVFSLSLPIAAIFAVKFFVPLYRSVNSPSAYTYLEKRFGPWAKTYASAMYLLTQLMRAGTILFLLSLLLSEVVGWNITTIIIVTGLSVMVYSLLGGIQAVAWTDAIQGIILIAGALISVGFLVFAMPDAGEPLFEIAAANDKFGLGSFSFDFTSSTFWVVLIYGLFINLQNFGIDQNYIQRYMSSRSDKAAQISALWGGLIYIPVSALFLFIGTALFSFYQAQPDLLPAGKTGDEVFPYFIVNQLPTGLTGLLIASIFAAGMSTISTSINSSATVILTDFFKFPAQSAITEKRSMTVLYISSLVFSLLSISVAVAMINVKSALDAWWKLASIFSGGMLGLFLLGFMAPKIKTTAAVIGVVAGVLVIGWMSLSSVAPEGSWLSAIASPFHSYLSIVFGTLALFITGFVVGVIINRFRKNIAEKADD